MSHTAWEILEQSKSWETIHVMSSVMTDCIRREELPSRGDQGSKTRRGLVAQDMVGLEAYSSRDGKDGSSKRRSSGNE